MVKVSHKYHFSHVLVLQRLFFSLDSRQPSRAILKTFAMQDDILLLLCKVESFLYVLKLLKWHLFDEEKPIGSIVKRCRDVKKLWIPAFLVSRFVFLINDNEIFRIHLTDQSKHTRVASGNSNSIVKSLTLDRVAEKIFFITNIGNGADR